MKLSTIIVTRSKSCHVKTLHTILRLNIKCFERQIQSEISFVNDDPFEKAKMIEDKLKTHDKVFFVNYSVHADDSSLDRIFDDIDGHPCIVFPAVTEGIDWEMFKEKVKSGSEENIAQMGLYFDTDVNEKKKLPGEVMYAVKTTKAQCWVMNSKGVVKALKDRKTGQFKIHPKMDVMFSKMQEAGVNIAAYADANITVTYTHECISNILSAAGIQTSA